MATMQGKEIEGGRHTTIHQLCREVGVNLEDVRSIRLVNEIGIADVWDTCTVASFVYYRDVITVNWKESNNVEGTQEVVEA